MLSVYLETSVISYLRENPSADEESRRRQESTRTWWKSARHRFELVTSQYVLAEAQAGHPDLVAERLQHLAGIPLVPPSAEIESLAAEILARTILPATAAFDAFHLACAAVGRTDYLLTWNCRHLANPMILPRVFRVLDDFELPFPVVCTPHDMLETYGHVPSA